MNKSVVRTIALSLFVVAVLSSCGSKYNKIKFPDPNKDNSDVYGNVGGDPLTVTTPSKPDPSVSEVAKEVAPKFRGEIEAVFQK